MGCKMNYARFKLKFSVSGHHDQTSSPDGKNMMQAIKLVYLVFLSKNDWKQFFAIIIS